MNGTPTGARIRMVVPVRETRVTAQADVRDCHRIVAKRRHDGAMNDIDVTSNVAPSPRSPQRRLRLAFVTETYPPEVNGVAATLSQIVEGMHRCHHEVQLIRPRQPDEAHADRGPAFREVLMRGLPIPNYPGLRMGLPGRRRLVALWQAQRPDAVHIATEGPLGWSALQAARQLGLPVVSDFRTNFHAYSQHYRLTWLMRPIMGYLRKFHNLAHCTMVPTAALQQDLEGSGFDRLVVVARGVDTQRFDSRKRSSALRRSWGAADDDLVVACVGRLAPEKNLNVLLKAFAAIQGARPEAKLVFVGDGPMRADLQRRCPQAVFAGQRSGDDLCAHYASADLLLFPSLTETFGNVTTEAMASGLAVVAYHYAAAAKVIRSGENGVTVPFGDEQAYVNAAAASAADPAMCRRMGRAARQSALELSWDAIVKRFESVVETVIRDDVAFEPPHLRAAQGHAS
jgi:glycosyltransferase involved in cell wall biosynthesis